VGGNQELRVDVRLIAATNRDIVDAIRQGCFREDLFHRLNVVQFRPPPLRERGDDIPLLAQHFLSHFCLAMNKPMKSFSTAAQQKLKAHPWPGNVRELRNAVERAVILERGSEVQAESLPDFQVEARLGRALGAGVSSSQSLDEALFLFERDLVWSMLERHHFNLNKTADQLRITRHALRYRMQRLNINMDGVTEDDAPPSPTKDPARV
jgi:DNA-binding NtrC family response regulator